MIIYASQVVKIVFNMFLAHENIGKDTLTIKIEWFIAKLLAKNGFSIMAVANLHINAFLTPFPH